MELFSGLPFDVQNVLKTAMTQVLNQQIYSEDPEKQYDVVSQSILDQLNKIETSLPSTLLSLQAPMDDSADFYALRECIMTIVAMGGITSEDQGTCLTESGYSLASLKVQFNDFVDINTFVLPANAIVSHVSSQKDFHSPIKADLDPSSCASCKSSASFFMLPQNQATKSINGYLGSVELVPAMEYLIGNASQSLQNVVLSVQANERDATTKAFECWIEALSVSRSSVVLSSVNLSDKKTSLKRDYRPSARNR